MSKFIYYTAYYVTADFGTIEDALKALAAKIADSFSHSSDILVNRFPEVMIDWTI